MSLALHTHFALQASHTHSACGHPAHSPLSQQSSPSGQFRLVAAGRGGGGGGGVESYTAHSENEWSAYIQGRAWAVERCDRATRSSRHSTAVVFGIVVVQSFRDSLVQMICNLSSLSM